MFSFTLVTNYLGNRSHIIGLKYLLSHLAWFGLFSHNLFVGPWIELFYNTQCSFYAILFSALLFVD
jgi:hypothetical protein